MFTEKNIPTIQTKVANGLQIFDLLDLSRKEREIKTFCLQTFEELHNWEKNLPNAINSAVQPYTKMRSAMLRRQARDAVKIYKAIRQSRMKLFKTYMDELPNVGAFKRLAS